jgi:hypothetical protein
MSYLTCLASTLATKTTVSFSTSFSDVTQLLPDNPQGKKCAMKMGTNIAAVEVITDPFGILPGNFGIQPLPAETLPPKRFTEEVAAEPDLKVTGREAAVVILAELKMLSKIAAAVASDTNVNGDEVAVVASDTTVTSSKKTSSSSIGHNQDWQRSGSNSIECEGVWPRSSNSSIKYEGVWQRSSIGSIKHKKLSGEEPAAVLPESKAMGKIAAKMKQQWLWLIRNGMRLILLRKVVFQKKRCLVEKSLLLVKLKKKLLLWVKLTKDKFNMSSLCILSCNTMGQSFKKIIGIRLMNSEFENENQN